MKLIGLNLEVLFLEKRTNIIKNGIIKDIARNWIIKKSILKMCSPVEESVEFFWLQIGGLEESFKAIDLALLLAYLDA